MSSPVELSIFFDKIEKTEDFKTGLTPGDCFEELNKINKDGSFNQYEIEKFLYLSGFTFKVFKENGRSVNRWGIKLK